MNDMRFDIMTIFDNYFIMTNGVDSFQEIYKTFEKKIYTNSKDIMLFCENVGCPTEGYENISENDYTTQRKKHFKSKLPYTPNLPMYANKKATFMNDKLLKKKTIMPTFRMIW